MTAKELLAFQFEEAGYQLAKVLEDYPEEAFDLKTTPTALSPRETLGHLAEVYVSVLAQAEGRQHEWGSYDPGTEDRGELMRILEEKRTAAVRAIEGLDEAKAVHLGADFIVAHDYYHVGQLSAFRLAAEPTWNAYSIYRFEP
jgi:hypothetical protein